MPKESGKTCLSGARTRQGIARVRSDKSRRHSVRHTSVCTPTRDKRQHPGTNPQSRRSLIPRVPCLEKRHMLLPANDQPIRRRPKRFRAGVNRCENETTHRQRTLATNGHLCVHTIGSSSLFGLVHSFHVPQPEAARMRTGKTGAFVSTKNSCPAGIIDSMSTHRPTQRAQPSRRITEGLRRDYMH